MIKLYYIPFYLDGTTTGDVFKLPYQLLRVSNGFIIEQQHEMYLNINYGSANSLCTSIEQQHEMYLNSVISFPATLSVTHGTTTGDVFKRSDPAEKYREYYIEQQHEMHLNASIKPVSKRIYKIEQQHEMYLNAYWAFVMSSSLSIEQQHEMYLNWSCTCGNRLLFHGTTTGDVFKRQSSCKLEI